MQGYKCIGLCLPGRVSEGFTVLDEIDRINERGAGKPICRGSSFWAICEAEAAVVGISCT